MRCTLIALLLAFTAIANAKTATAQGHYRRTVRRNPVTGRQEIIDLHQLQWDGQSQGGVGFDAASGSLQMTAIRRSHYTRRLEYRSVYMNPWTGAVLSTNTRFNPFSHRYETAHQIAPPPPRAKAVANVEQEPVIDFQSSQPPRGIKVIEVKQPSVVSENKVAPKLEAKPTANSSVVPLRKAASD